MTKAFPVKISWYTFSHSINHLEKLWLRTAGHVHQYTLSLQDYLRFRSLLFLVRVLQGELQFRPELRVTAAQSLQQQSCLLLKLLQLALRALILLDQLIRAHGDSQQAWFVENVVGIAEAFLFVNVHWGGILVLFSIHPVAVNLSPQFICVGQQRAGPCQRGERLVTQLLLTFSCLWMVVCCFKVGDRFDWSLQCWLWDGGAIEPVAAVVPPLPLVISWCGTHPQFGWSHPFTGSVRRVWSDFGIGLEDGHVAFWLSDIFRACLWRAAATIWYHGLKKNHLWLRHHF